MKKILIGLTFLFSMTSFASTAEIEQLKTDVKDLRKELIKLRRSIIVDTSNADQMSAILQKYSLTFEGGQHWTTKEIVTALKSCLEELKPKALGKIKSVRVYGADDNYARFKDGELTMFKYTSADACYAAVTLNN